MDRRTSVMIVLVTFAASALPTPAYAGTWGTRQAIQGIFAVSSPPDVPVVAMNASGHFVAAWDSTGNIRFAERTSSGWSPSRSVVPGATGGPVAVGIGADGTTAVAWDTAGDWYHPSKLVVSVRPTEGPFSAPAEIAPGAGAWYFKVGIAADGAVTLVWSDGAVKAATLAPGGAWSATQTLSPSGSLPDLAVNDAGGAVAVWQDGAPGNPAQIGASYRPAGGSWTAPEIVSTGTGGPTWNPKPGIDASGNAAVGYLDGNAMTVAVRPANGGWGTPTTVSPPSQAAYYPALAVDGAGDMVAAWQTLDAGNSGRIYGSWMPAGGAWGAVSPISGARQNADWPTAAISGDGSIGGVTWIDDTTLGAKIGLGPVGGPWTTSPLGPGYWGSVVPVAAGGGSIGAAWAMVGIPGNPNAARLVARVYA